MAFQKASGGSFVRLEKKGQQVIGYLTGFKTVKAKKKGDKDWFILQIRETSGNAIELQSNGFINNVVMDFDGKRPELKPEFKGFLCRFTAEGLQSKAETPKGRSPGMKTTVEVDPEKRLETVRAGRKKTQK